MQATDVALGSGSERRAGGILAAAALGTIAFMAMHPAIHAHDPAGFAAEVERIATRNRVVHGGLVGLMLLVLLGLLGLVDRIGWRSSLARFGLAAYALGVAAHSAAATINGFVVPALAMKYAAAGEKGIEPMRTSLVLCVELNGAAASVGLYAMSAGIACWALALLRGSGAARAVGGFGLAVGLVLPLALAFGGIGMDVHGFGVRVLAQALWYLAVAWLLSRRSA